MSGSEIVYRIRTFARTQIERWGYLTANKVESPNLSRTSKSWLNEFPIVEISHYSKAADALLEGQLNIFSLQNTNIGSILQWNHDPLTGKKAPLSFGKTLNCSDPQLVGDIKYLWELNRHLQFVTMAQAYRLSGDR
ncbi:MAG: heparinase, partial [Deltaproteobacteria bacterium]|nr:heparinase [Deltaproteobacteria bacterium]